MHNEELRAVCACGQPLKLRQDGACTSVYHHEPPCQLFIVVRADVFALLQNWSCSCCGKSVPVTPVSIGKSS